MRRVMAMALMSVFACLDVHGVKTNYVDCSLNDYSGHDGSSWASAFKTIQEGVDAAESGDTVLVAPGYYDEGGATIGDADMFLTNRVCITKRITVRSRDGRASRDKTFIVGRHSENPDDPNGVGLGLDAVRCVRFAFDNATHGAVVEGFTLINGATHYNDNNYAYCSAGGGVFAGKRSTSHSQASYLVDCVVSNCVATRGGGMYFGNAVRCRFTGNKVTHGGSAVRDGNLYYCVVDANVGTVQAYLGGVKAINCTFANSAIRALRGNSYDTICSLYNSVALAYDQDSSSTFMAVTNCVIPARVNFNAFNDVGETAIDRTVRVEMMSTQFVSSATGDYRPLAGCDLIGVGDAEHLKLIPEQYRYTDYEGNAVAETGAITAGAIISPVSVEGGYVKFVSYYNHEQYPGVMVNGYMHYVYGLCSHGVKSKIPTVYETECVMPTDPGRAALRDFFGFSVGYENESEGIGYSIVYHPPLRGTKKSYIMSPPAGGLLTVQPFATECTIWADAEVKDGAEMDGSEEKPYNTLQAAVDAAFATELPEGLRRYFIIKAKPGYYDKGGTEYAGMSNRVAVTASGTHIRLYGTEGAEKTFIVGAEDPDSTHEFKYGPAAVRCFATCTGNGSLNGFTLTGGRVSLNDGSEDDGAFCLYGAGVFSLSSAYSVEDCVITNCAGSRGSAAWAAILRRCLVTDCTTTKIGALRGGVRASACVFKNMYRSHIVGQNERAYNCTFISSHDNGVKLVGYTAVTPGDGIYNSVAHGIYVLEDAPKCTFVGSYYGNAGIVEDGVLGYTGLKEANIRFADPDNRDYTLCSVCAPVNGGDLASVDDEFWRYGSALDINCMPFSFGDDGKITAGAFAGSVPSMSVTAAVPDGVAAVSVSPEGESILMDGESVTYVANDAATRNFQGFYLDGELLTTDASYTYTFNAGDDGAFRELEARYVPYWYVDPSKSDNNGGRSWADAKQSLAEVMKLAVAGDTVYAEQGSYDIGDMIQHKNSYKADPLLRARVVLTNGVSLVSRRGPEKTFIVGKSATVDLDGFGGGTDALRCVYMYPDTRLEGFTLTGGRSYGLTEQDDNNRGIGVHGWMNALSLVKDCVISNCVGARAGGSTHVTAVNCRYLHNRGYYNCAAAQHSFHHNCYFDYNVSGEGETGSFVIGYWRGLRNCTFGVNNFLNRNEYMLGPSAENNVQHPQVYNTLVLRGGVYRSASTEIQSVFTNCAFTTAALETWPENGNCLYDDKTIFADPSQLQTDENGVPIPGKNVAIDKGDMRYVDTELCTTDLAGNPRAVNGLKMDIGCYEADWKGRYADDLGSRLYVTKASPAVYETDERTVGMVDGTEVTISLNGSGDRKSRQSVTFRVTGDGTLTLNVDGETFTYTDTGAVQTYASYGAAAERVMAFSFAGTGSAELIGCSNSLGMSLVIR